MQGDFWCVFMLKICLSVFALQLFYMMVYIEIVKTWLYGHVFYAHGRPEEKCQHALMDARRASSGRWLFRARLYRPVQGSRSFSCSISYMYPIGIKDHGIRRLGQPWSFCVVGRKSECNLENRKVLNRTLRAKWMNGLGDFTR